jgi:amino acid adenylation domain-containing protein
MAYLLQQLLTQTAERRPEQVAVVDQARSISYAELESRSNQLAQVLVDQGVRRGDRVGLCLSKSLEAIVGLFGILKAGAAYVPLDPASPARRLAFILGNCATRALVTSERKLRDLAPTFSELPDLELVVIVDSSGDVDEPLGGSLERPRRLGPRALDSVSSDPPALSQPPIEDDLAYILYTSGSTGEPKGVMISHRASLTFVDWACAYFGLDATDRLSSHAPLHFDLSIFDLFAAVEAGASIVLVPEALSVFPINLAQLIERERITTWYSVPSVLSRLVLHGNLRERDLSALRRILFAGEVFPTKYLRQLQALIPQAEYHNLYGPTETNVCTHYRVELLGPEQTDPVPIGRACANSEVFALDERGQLAAPGELGELYVRGPSLMKGYWGAPERTAEVLLPHPLGELASEQKVYRTGDLVILQADGTYRFVGRRDSMVKSRGYRIELGEIEAALYAHPGVEEAAVLPIPDELIGNTLHAVVAARDPAPTVGDLLRFCAERLPRYMLPGEVEVRATLPKTSTGKIDRSALARERLESRPDRAERGNR